DPRNADEPFLEGAQDDDTAEGPGRDAIPDGLERYLRSIGTRTPVTARSDTDGDGVPDALEVASGTDPRDPDDPVRDGPDDLVEGSGPPFDGISDGLESYLLRRGARPPLTRETDTDEDGIADV